MLLHGLRDRASDHKHLLTGSAAVVATVVLQALSGSASWLIAARIDDQADVGHATALYTSVLFVAFVAGLGLPVATARYAAGRTRDDHVLFTWASLATTGASVVGSVAYLGLVQPRAADELTDWHGVAGPALFALLTVGSALSLLLDVRLMTQRRWGLVFARAVFVTVARLPLLALPGDSHRAVWLLLAVTLPTALSGAVGVLLLRRVTGDGHHLSPRPASARPMVRYSLVNWLSTVSYQAPTFVLPVIVLVHVGASTNASFYVAWGVGSLACYVPTAIGQALLTEGGRDGAHLRAQVRIALLVSVSLMVVAAVAAFLGRDLLPSLYGDDYAEAADILPGLVAAAIPWAVTSIFLTEARVRHRTADTVAITVVLSGAILLPALYLVPEHGLGGAVVSFMVGNLLAAALSLAAHQRGLAAAAGDPLVPPAHEQLEPEDVVVLAPLT
jgi:O-antigen/teichoic acid export membrane protein